MLKQRSRAGMFWSILPFIILGTLHRVSVQKIWSSLRFFQAILPLIDLTKRRVIFIRIISFAKSIPRQKKPNAKRHVKFTELAGT
jgi:TRAP-type C4-dicarboxylate transport system permease large subunit